MSGFNSLEELKVTSVGSLDPTTQSFNRTLEELKHIKSNGITKQVYCFNRTSNIRLKSWSPMAFGNSPTCFNSSKALLTPVRVFEPAQCRIFPILQGEMGRSLNRHTLCGHKTDLHPNPARGLL